MQTKSTLSLVLSSVTALALFSAGCDRVGEFRNIVEGGTEALAREDAAYRTLKTAAQARGEGSLAALSEWSATLNNVRAVMGEATKKLKGKHEQKIRANKDVQTQLARFRQGIDGLLGRNFAEAALKLVPPWRMQDAQALAAAAPSTLTQISSFYEAVFATTNPQAGKAFSLEVQEDTAILDTYQPCVDKVSVLAKGQAKSGYCVSAAQSSCGHQINLGCLEEKVKPSLANNTCPDVKTVTLRIPADETFRPEAHIGATEELKEWKYGTYVDEANPDRVFGTFCPGEYDAAAKAVLSTTHCFGARGKARIYGYNEDRHVLVEIEGVRHADDPRKDVLLNIYAEGAFVGTRVIRSDRGWGSDNVYRFHVTERAFQPGSNIKLMFQNLMDVNFTDQATGQVSTRKTHWIVEAQIRGMDVPLIRKREVHLTKYTPNSWVGGLVRSCTSATPVLK